MLIRTKDGKPWEGPVAQYKKDSAEEYAQGVHRAELDIRLKAVGEPGDPMIIRGYLNVFNIIDHHADITVPGCFAKAIAEKFPRNLIKHLWQHRMLDPLAVYQRLEEDDIGLFMEARIPEGPVGRERFNQIAAGLVDRASIGYRIVEFERVDDPAIIDKLPEHLRGVPVWRLLEIDLIEGSSVTMAANDHSIIRAVSGSGGNDDEDKSKRVVIEISGTKGALAIDRSTSPLDFQDRIATSLEKRLAKPAEPPAEPPTADDVPEPELPTKDAAANKDSEPGSTGADEGGDDDLDLTATKSLVDDIRAMFAD